MDEKNLNEEIKEETEAEVTEVTETITEEGETVTETITETVTETQDGTIVEETVEITEEPAPAKVCTSCGAEIEDGAEFCASCGAKVSEENASGVMLFDENGNPITQAAANAAPAKSKAGLVVGIVIAALVVILGVYLAISAAMGVSPRSAAYKIPVVGKIVGNPYNADYVDVTGRTVGDLAKEMGMSLDEFLAQFDLPKDMPADTTETAARYNIPTGKMAEMSGASFEQMKQVLHFAENITEDTPWGVTEGELRVGDYIGSDDNVQMLKEMYGLGDEVTADTKWKDIRNQIDEKQREEYMTYKAESEAAANQAPAEGQEAAPAADAAAQAPADAQNAQPEAAPAQ